MRTTTVNGIETARWISGHESLPVVWNDPPIDTVGFDPRSPYVERYWLAVLGPSSTKWPRHSHTRVVSIGKSRRFAMRQIRPRPSARSSKSCVELW